MKSIIFITILLLFCNSAIADYVDGKINHLRTHTDKHWQTLARQVLTFSVTLNSDSDKMIAPCTEFFISNNDKQAMSMLLSAKVTSGELRIHYSPTMISPWGQAHVCGVVAIDFI